MVTLQLFKDYWSVISQASGTNRWSLNMATELVSLATSEKLTEVDWTKNIELCELVAKDQRYLELLVIHLHYLVSCNSNWLMFHIGTKTTCILILYLVVI